MKSLHHLRVSHMKLKQPQRSCCMKFGYLTVRVCAALLSSRPAPTQWSPWPLPCWLTRSGLRAGQCWPPDWRSSSPPSTRGGAASSASRRRTRRRYSTACFNDNDIKPLQYCPSEDNNSNYVTVFWGTVIPFRFRLYNENTRLVIKKTVHWKKK